MLCIIILIICGTPIIIIFLFQTAMNSSRTAGDDGRYKTMILSHKTVFRRFIYVLRLGAGINIHHDNIFCLNVRFKSAI